MNLDVKNPETAKCLHKYGNGQKVIYDETECWINPDLTQSERQANFKARSTKECG